MTKNKSKQFLAAFLIMGMTSGTALAVECADQELIKSGDIVGVGKSIGFMIGVRWGEGAVRLNDGTIFEFKAKGIKAAEMGMSKVQVRGTVYNLKSIEDFNGVFAGVAGGLTVANKGAGFASFTNEKCVTVHIKREKVIGVQGSAPMVAGLTVEVTKIRN